MKNKYAILLSLITLLLSTGLTSCYVDTDDWWSGPPTGWDTFNDTRLRGTWQLVLYNGDPVYSSDVNYMYFNGNGAGYYFYMVNGYRYTENIRYWSQESNSGTSSYQINIQYENDSPVTENYWFTAPDRLWFQWRNSQGVQTSVYERVPNFPWRP